MNEHNTAIIQALVNAGGEPATALCDLLLEYSSTKARAMAQDQVIEAYRVSARRLVIAAKQWTRVMAELSSPEVRQAAVDELADAIDAFDPLLSESVP